MGGKPDNGILVIKPPPSQGRKSARFTLSDLPTQGGPAAGPAAQNLRRKIRGWKLLGESLSSESESLNKLLSLLGPPIKIDGLGEIGGAQFKAAKITTLSRQSPVLLLTNVPPDDIIEAYGGTAPLDTSRRASFRSKTPPQETYYLVAASAEISEVLSAGPGKAPAEGHVPESPTAMEAGKPAAPVLGEEAAPQEPEDGPSRPLLGKGSHIPPRPTLAELIADKIEDEGRARPSVPGEDIDEGWDRISGEIGPPGLEGAASEEHGPQEAPPAAEAPAGATTHDEAEPEANGQEALSSGEAPAEAEEVPRGQTITGGEPLAEEAPPEAPETIEAAAGPQTAEEIGEMVVGEESPVGREQTGFDLFGFLKELKNDRRIRSHSNPQLAYAHYAGDTMVLVFNNSLVRASNEAGVAAVEKKLRSLGVTRAYVSDEPENRYIQVLTDIGSQYRLYEGARQGENVVAALEYGERGYTLVRVA